MRRHRGTFAKLLREAENKAERILEGWDNVFNENEVIEELAEKRATLCANCPEATFGLICAKCTCPLIAKVRSPGESCPLGKWTENRQLKSNDSKPV